MYRNGFGVFLDYEDVPEKDLRRSADGKKAAAFWVSRRSEDRYDDDTSYEIAVWDPATRQKLESYTRGHSIAQNTGTVTGKPLRDVRFDGAGTLILIFDDGSEERAKDLPGTPLPPP